MKEREAELRSLREKTLTQIKGMVQRVRDWGRLPSQLQQKGSEGEETLQKEHLSLPQCVAVEAKGICSLEPGDTATTVVSSTVNVIGNLGNGPGAIDPPASKIFPLNLITPKDKFNWFPQNLIDIVKIL